MTLSSRSYSRIFVSLVLASTLFGLSGCALLLVGVGAGAGAGGAIYVLGKLEDEVNVSVPTLRKATVAALKDLDMPIVKDRGDQLTAKVESRTADNKPVWITIDSMTKTRSKISIRVGYTGDEVKARRILDAIRRHI